MFDKGWPTQSRPIFLMKRSDSKKNNQMEEIDFK